MNTENRCPICEGPMIAYGESYIITEYCSKRSCYFQRVTGRDPYQVRIEIATDKGANYKYFEFIDGTSEAKLHKKAINQLVFEERQKLRDKINKQLLELENS